MPEWRIERGIGETRCALLEGDRILEARVLLDGIARAGSITAARLTRAADRNAIALASDGAEYLLPRGAPGFTEGASIAVEVTREAIPGIEPWKRPLARLSDREPAEGQVIGGAEGMIPHDEWDDLVEEARTGSVNFAGGELRISPTPAMTLIDVDGAVPADELAVVGAREAARAIRRLDVGGSIGIDLPTARSKAARQRAADAIDANLPQPFERTAVNGFGFVQIVRPRVRASLVELAADRVSFEARDLLRRAALEPPGATRLVAHPSLVKLLDRPQWLARLARQIGGAVSLRADPALPISGAYAEKP